MRILLLVVLGASLSGCLWHRQPRPGTHIYQGDSPKTHYINPETAGGPLHSY